MNQVISSLQQKAETEWCNGSGVAPQIATLNLHTIQDPKKIASLLNWKYYKGTGGWYVRSIDLLSGQYSSFGQFKPTEALLFPNQEKAQKYISFPKGDGTEIILLLPTIGKWQAIADKYRVPITPSDIREDRLDKGFWLWVADNPQLPLEVTEGAKKAGCLLSYNFIPLCVTGVWNGKQKGKLKAIATLAPFLTNGRLTLILLGLTTSTLAIVPKVDIILTGHYPKLITNHC